MVRYRVIIEGLVQGVGFRPYVWKLASGLGLSGWVRNDARGVVLEVQGDATRLQQFLAELPRSAPPQSVVSSLYYGFSQEVDQEAGFKILESPPSDSPKCIVSPDLATCADCLGELRDPENRRYAYPFINCTQCGPRFTIQVSVPYDRARTTMREFPLCQRCRSEYESPADRRFHAEPNACPDCGPAIWYLTSDCLLTIEDAARSHGEPIAMAELAEARQASGVLATIERVRQAIANGKIVAIKGVGGFHLACDATNPSAIALLRYRKQRPFKPLAVMVADVKTASGIAHLTRDSQSLLESPQRPIILVSKIAGALPDEVSPNNPWLGLLLPYTPIHHLLIRPGEVWVMTSGNLADEPIAYQNDDALLRLKSLSDGFLMHNRPIHTVCDDSVVRCWSHGVIPIRRSRGYVPLPIEISTISCSDISLRSGRASDDQSTDGGLAVDNLSGSTRVESEATILAVGGELKSALCLMSGCQAIMGQHVGDMGHRETLDALARSRDHLLSLYQAKPVAVAADLHPNYISTSWARNLAQDWKVPFIQVQHHHAHAAALIAEYGLPMEQPIIACVLDGTGYGSDGAIWGGEVLVATAKSFHRVAHLEYLPLPGGDSAILEPAKTALAFLFACGHQWNPLLQSVQHFPVEKRELLRRQLENNLQVVQTSSMGRLFDAVASLIGLRQRIDYEGQAAFELEATAERGFKIEANVQAYTTEWTHSSPSQLCVGAMLGEICRDVISGVDTSIIAARFHQTIADSLVTICKQLGKCQTNKRNGRLALCPVGLSGGVFQNAVLLELTHSKLQAAGFEVLTHRHVPPNDGGLALGQATVARAHLPIK